jgi:hypothetical protein
MILQWFTIIIETIKPLRSMEISEYASNEYPDEEGLNKLALDEQTDQNNPKYLY